MMQNKLEKNPQKSVQIKNWPEKIRIFSGAQLKYLAFISMLIDHVNKALIYPNLDGSAGLQIISDLFDILGRIHVPSGGRVLQDPQQMEIPVVFTRVRCDFRSAL